MFIEPPPQWATQYLRSRLQIPDFDYADLHHILQSAADIMFEDRGRAEQALTTTVFREWLLSPESAKLLIHGDFGVTNKVSPFTVLCATVLQVFRVTAGYIGLAFFCGLHLQGDEIQGPSVMIRSLVTQLLRQYPRQAIDPDAAIDLDAVAERSIEHLCELFVFLVRQLPPTVTVFCVVDGVNEYEDEDYFDELDQVIVALLNLMDGENRSGARIKLLLASPQPTTIVRQIFDDEPGILLHMQSVPLVEEAVPTSPLRERLLSDNRHQS